MQEGTVWGDPQTVDSLGTVKIYMFFMQSNKPSYINLGGHLQVSFVVCSLCNSPYTLQLFALHHLDP